jgi:hypothetical protein
MPSVETEGSELRGRLTAILLATPSLLRVLAVARRLCLPDWLVFSGAVYQPVLNHLTGRPLDYGNAEPIDAMGRAARWHHRRCS